MLLNYFFHQFDVVNVAQLYFREVYRLHGLPEVVNGSLGDLLRSLVVIISGLEIINYFKRSSLTINWSLNQKSIGFSSNLVVYGSTNPPVPIDLALVPNLKRVNTKAEDRSYCSNSGGSQSYCSSFARFCVQLQGN